MILGGRDVRRAAKFMRRCVVQGLAAWTPDTSRVVESAVQTRAWPSDRAPTQTVPDTVRDVRTHMLCAAASLSPSATEGRSLHPDAMAAVCHVAAMQGPAEAWRDRRRRISDFKRAHRMLASTRAKLDAITPDYIRRMPHRADPAMLAAASRAFDVRTRG